MFLRISILFLAFTLSTVTAQVAYEVSQGDGAGGFFPVGVLVPYTVTSSATAYYNYDGANPGFTGPAPTLGTDTSHLWLMDSPVDGLGIVFVHDKENDGSGGHAETVWTLAGDPSGAQWLVQDGPPAFGDAYTGSPGDSLFTADQAWPGANSDGGILGPLDGDWFMDVEFDDVDGNPANDIVGLSSWVAYSSDGSTTTLNLTPGIPVRIAAITPPTLTPDSPTFSFTASSGVNLETDAGPARANRLFVVLGSLSTAPGIPVAGELIPLNQDFYFNLTLNMPNTFPLTNSSGMLDGTGKATTVFDITGVPPAIAGISVYHATVVVSLTRFVSAPAQTTITL